ncbi:hypothetical protein [Mycobacterium sp. AT1]|nr:hypothetical protein [Mycobacterium sp. AT1]
MTATVVMIAVTGIVGGYDGRADQRRDLGFRGSWRLLDVGRLEVGGVTI